MDYFFRREYQLKQSFNTTHCTRIQSLTIISASFHNISVIANTHLNMATVINKSVGPIGYGLMGGFAQNSQIEKKHFY